MKLYIIKGTTSDLYYLTDNDHNAIGIADVSMLNYKPNDLSFDIVQSDENRIAYLNNTAEPTYCMVNSVRYYQMKHAIDIESSGEISEILGMLDDIIDQHHDNVKMINKIKLQLLKIQFKKTPSHE